MLLSPGHSPRHITSPPPSSSEGILIPSSTADPATAAGGNKRRRVVLDEDSYVAAIEKIIERDYFPDIPKLRDRLDWLEAVRSGDPVIIRDAQLKIMERRAGQGRSSSVAPDATASARAGSLVRTPSTTPFGFDATPSASLGNSDSARASASEGGEPADSSLSLDDFFSRYTSEDNESFSKILEKVNLKRKQKVLHLLERDGEEPVQALEEARTEQITDGYGSSGQPADSLIGWKYTAKNLLMYYPADKGELPLTESEMAVRIQGQTKEISRSNTRFNPKSVELKPSKQESAPVLFSSIPGTTPAGASWPFENREAERAKRYDLEELRKTPEQAFYMESDKEPVKGYSFVKTPSPAPGVDESPFMTWGEIEGTPLRLDMDDVPLEGGGGGPQFSIQLPPARDIRAHSLSREASKRLREKSRMFRKPPLPSPVRAGSASPRMRTLSPAAQKFVRNAFAKSSRSTDEMLRASYRGTSPGVGTPRERRPSRLAKEGSLDSRSPSSSQGPTLH